MAESTPYPNLLHGSSLKMAQQPKALEEIKTLIEFRPLIAEPHLFGKPTSLALLRVNISCVKLQMLFGEPLVVDMVEVKETSGWWPSGRGPNEAGRQNASTDKRGQSPENRPQPPQKASSQQHSQASSSASSAAGRATSPTAANRAAAASARRPSPVNTDRPASPATARPTAPPDSNRPNPSAAPVTSRPTTAASPSRRVTPPRQTFTPPRTTANRPQPSTSGPSDVKNTYQASNFPPPAGIPYSSRDVSPARGSSRFRRNSPKYRRNQKRHSRRLDVERKTSQLGHHHHHGAARSTTQRGQSPISHKINQSRPRSTPPQRGFRRRRSSLSTHHHRGARPTVQAAPPVVIPTPVRVEQNQPENAQPSEEAETHHVVFDPNQNMEVYQDQVILNRPREVPIAKSTESSIEFNARREEVKLTMDQITSAPPPKPILRKSQEDISPLTRKEKIRLRFSSASSSSSSVVDYFRWEKLCSPRVMTIAAATSIVACVFFVSLGVGYGLKEAE